MPGFPPTQSAVPSWHLPLDRSLSRLAANVPASLGSHVTFLDSPREETPVGYREIGST